MRSVEHFLIELSSTDDVTPIRGLEFGCLRIVFPLRITQLGCAVPLLLIETFML